MSFQTGSIDADGLARTSDGKLYVQVAGDAAITGGNGVPVLVAQSGVSVAAPADTNENTLATVTLPANSLGANGLLIIEAVWVYTGTAGSHNAIIKFGGTSIYSHSSGAAITIQSNLRVRNRGATNSQFCNQYTVTSASTVAAGAISTPAIDTTAAVTILFNATKANGADGISLEGYSLWFCKPVA